MLLTPSPLSQTVTPRAPSPLERDVLYGRLNHKNSNVSLNSTVIPDKLCTLEKLRVVL